MRIDLVLARFEVLAFAVPFAYVRTCSFDFEDFLWKI